MRTCTLIAFLMALLWPIAYAAADENVIFNHTSDQHNELDDLVHEHFGKQYTVVDIDDGERGYVKPQGTNGFGPTPPVYVNNHCIHGNVLVLYVITTGGLVSAPYAAKSSDPLLSDIAVRLMSESRFRPAQVEGKPVSSVAGTWLLFGCSA